MNEVRDIKIKPFNLLIFILFFIATFGVVSGVDAKVDENTIYALKELYKNEQNLSDMNLIVEKLKAEIKYESSKLENLKDKSYLEEVIAMNKEIEELKFYNGFTDVRGPGIMIRVSDSKSEDESLDIMDKIVHDVDITILLNDLKSAGAEAIDVNGKRIINISEVVCAGPLLKINGESVPAPFIIRAVGDQEALYNVVNDEGSYAYKLKNTFGMEVVTMMSYNLVIPKFYGNNYEVKYTITKD
jgi:uncharacterized protein YlxW (UPF0749 family)